MVSEKEANRKKFILNCAYYAVIFAIVWICFKYLLGWFMPFIAGYLLAALVQPTVRVLHKRLRVNRRAAGIITVLFFVIFLFMILSLCVTSIVTELASVAGLLPGLLIQLADSVNRISGSISKYIDSMPVQYSERIAQALSDASGELIKLSSISRGTVSFAFNLASKVPGLLFDTVIAVVAACFMSMDYGSIRGFVFRQLSPRAQKWACEVKNFFFFTVSKMIRAYLTLMLITFVELAIGFLLFRIPHAVTVAAVIAVVDFLPVLGTGSVMIPWAVIELLMGNFYLAFCLTALYAVISVIRNILEPKIVGHHIGLYPLVTLFAMFTGLKLFGISGMILLPVIVIILKHMQDSGSIRIWRD